MLCTHLFEVLLWAITLVLTDAVPDFRDAFYYSSVTYTTLVMKTSCCRTTGDCWRR
jgi:hypothetical protein